MNYQISLNKIKELFNPLEDNIFPVDISYTMIENLLENHDIFPKDENDIIRQVAYAVANYEYRELHFVIPENLHKNNKQACASICVDGIIDLTAAIYLNESHIIGRIDGNKKQVKDLLNVNLDHPDNLDIAPDLHTPEKIVWKIDEEMVSHTWGDKEFILSYFVTSSGSAESKVKALINFMNPKLWDDSKLLCDLFLSSSNPHNVEYIKTISKNKPEILNKLSFFEAAKKDKRMFYLLWGEHYLPIFDLSMHSKSNFEQLSDPYFSYEKIQELKPLLDSIKKDFLSDENTVTELLQSISIYAQRGRTLKHISENILLQPSILRQVKEITQHFDIKKAVPDEYLNNFEWLKEFLVILSGNLNLHNLKYFGEEKDMLIPFFSSWINDKSKVLNMLKTVRNSDIADLYYVLPENLKEDKDIIQSLIVKNPLIFLSLKNKQQKDYIELYIEHANLVNYFPIELFASIPTREGMKKLVSKGYDKWLNNPIIPKSLAYDLELLSCLPSISVESLDPELISLIEKDNNTITSIMKKCKNLYPKLSKNKQRDCYIALHALAENYTDIDSVVFNSRGFCLTALEFQPQLVHRIPKDYWNDKGFIVQLLEKIDEKKIQPQVLIHGAKELVHLLSFFEVKSNYSGFLENYLLNNKLENKLNNKEDNSSTKIKKRKI